MNEQLARTIQNLTNLDEVLRFEANARQRNGLSDEIQVALRLRARVVLQGYIADQTGLNLSDPTPAEARVLEAVSDYVLIKKRQRTNANRTLAPLKNHGLLGAVELAVCQSKPTAGYQTLKDESREDLSYERIVLDFPDEFSPRALWYARRTLGQPNETEKAPTDQAGKVQTRTRQLVAWLSERAAQNQGQIRPYSNAQAAEAMGISDMSRYGRVHGNIQSRLDYACLVANLPPLGLTAEAPFSEAWATQDRSWSFPVQNMQPAAQNRVWQRSEFERILAETDALPGQAHYLWHAAMADRDAGVRAWAEGLKADEVAEAVLEDDEQAEPGASAATRNPPWSREELILLLDLYLKNPRSPASKDSKEVDELSSFLNLLGTTLHGSRDESFRNANGVYMKMMNFRRFDPEFVANGSRVGLQRGNKDEEHVWTEFAMDAQRLSSVVRSIHSALQAHIEGEEALSEDEPEIVDAPEGKVLTRLHRTRERSRKLVAEKKRLAKARNDHLACEACGFRFEDKYGADAAGIIDCHHTRPVHTLGESSKTHLDDLSLLCANCHRVVHSTRPWLSIDQLRDRLCISSASIETRP